MPAQSYTHEVKPKTHVPTSRGDRPRGEIRVVVLPSSLATILVVAMTVVAMMVLVVVVPPNGDEARPSSSPPSSLQGMRTLVFIHSPPPFSS